MGRVSLEERAREFASRRHAGQLRKDGKTPYINHCASVVDLLKQAGVSDEETLSAAWLHDVIEDCDVSRDEIEMEFGGRVASIVYVLTRNVDRVVYKDRLKHSDRVTQMVKLADTVHNCSEMGGPYIQEKTRRTKVEDCEDLYIDLSRELSPFFHGLLKKHLEPYRNS